MATRGCWALFVVFLSALASGAALAQTSVNPLPPVAGAADYRQPEPMLVESGPRWHEFQRIVHRLEAVETDNARLLTESHQLGQRTAPQAYPNSSASFTTHAVEQAGCRSEVDSCACGASQDCCNCCPDCGKGDCDGVPHICGLSLESLSWNKGRGWRIVPFGSATVETIYTSDATTALPFILYVNPRTANRQKRFTVTGQSTSLGFRVSGPPIGSFQTGALLLFDFHGDRPILNESSPYFIRGYGEIYNKDWRLAFGQNADIVAPLSPITLNWTAMAAAGDFGYGQRGQIRLERYLYFSETVQWTITGGISQQVVPDFIDTTDVTASDNGVPNFEGRIALALGCEEAGQRPMEVGLSGVVGQLVDLDNFGPLVSDTWGTAVDFSLSGERVGVRGEFFSGEGIGTYNGAINQSLNTVTGLPIQTIGGWGQVWCKPLPCVTSAVGYGIDDPRDEDLADDQRSRNQVFFATFIWDVTDFFQVGLEYSRWETDYIAPSIGNQADAVFSRMMLKF